MNYFNIMSYLYVIANVVDLKNKQDLTIVNQDTVKITTLDLNPLKPLRLRKLSGDTLSICKF